MARLKPCPFKESELCNRLKMPVERSRGEIREFMATRVSNAVESDFSQQLREWIEAFDEVVVGEGPEQGAELLTALKQRAREAGISQASELTTRYMNTIPKHEEVAYPGDRALERRIEALIRWNAMAMVHGQNKKDPGIGGHISTYSSLATLQEVGYNHFFHAKYIACLLYTSRCV